MAETKVVISATVTLAHPDGTRLRKKDVAAYLRELIEEDEGNDDMRPTKAVVRAVDTD